MTIRALVVDDAPVARERLVELLGEEPDVQIVGTCATGMQAVAAITEHHPDLVFLDLQMPEMDGFGVIQTVGSAQMPPVIFVTAYEQYALRAFDVQAVDYLLKPFTRPRFRLAVERVRGHIDRARSAQLAYRLVKIAREVAPAPPAADRVMVRSGVRTVFLNPDEIDWIEADGNYVRFHVGRVSHLHRDTMEGIIGRLGRERFQRIHRSTCVNMRRVAEMRSTSGGDAEVVLSDGRRLKVGRMFRRRLQERMAAGW